MLSVEDLKLVQLFLNRANLTGAEVPMWVQCFNAVNAAMVDPQTPVVAIPIGMAKSANGAAASQRVALNGTWFVASLIIADGRYLPFGGPQWTADGGVPTVYPSIFMPNFYGVDYYSASTVCFANAFVPKVFGYQKVNYVAAGNVVNQSAPAQTVQSGLVTVPNTVVGFTIAANPYLLSITADETA